MMPCQPLSFLCNNSAGCSIVAPWCYQWVEWLNNGPRLLTPYLKLSLQPVDACTNIGDTFCHRVVPIAFSMYVAPTACAPKTHVFDIFKFVAKRCKCL